MIERALIFPAWLLFRLFFLCLYYPTRALGLVQAWLAEGYRNA